MLQRTKIWSFYALNEEDLNFLSLLRVKFMNESEKENLFNFFDSIRDLDSEALMSKVEEHLDDEAIEIFVDHIQDFYGIDDDEELGLLAQIMISGYLAGKAKV